MTEKVNARSDYWSRDLKKSFCASERMRAPERAIATATATAIATCPNNHISVELRSEVQQLTSSGEILPRPPP
jgi:hypothetical protein